MATIKHCNAEINKGKSKIRITLEINTIWNPQNRAPSKTIESPNLTVASEKLLKKYAPTKQVRIAGQTDQCTVLEKNKNAIKGTKSI